MHTTPSAGYPWQVVQNSWSGEQFELPAGDEPRVRIEAFLTEEGCRKLVEIGGKSLDDLLVSARSRDFKPVQCICHCIFSLTVGFGFVGRRTIQQPH